MAQWLKALAALPEDLGPVPNTQTAAQLSATPVPWQPTLFWTQRVADTRTVHRYT